MGFRCGRRVRMVAVCPSLTPSPAGARRVARLFYWAKLPRNTRPSDSARPRPRTSSAAAAERPPSARRRVGARNWLEASSARGGRTLPCSRRPFAVLQHIHGRGRHRRCTMPQLQLHDRRPRPPQRSPAHGPISASAPSEPSSHPIPPTRSTTRPRRRFRSTSTRSGAPSTLRSPRPT